MCRKKIKGRRKSAPLKESIQGHPNEWQKIGTQGTRFVAQGGFKIANIPLLQNKAHIYK